MLTESHQNYFELLGLPQKFSIDSTVLDQNYRRLQSEVHPDRFAAAPSADRLRSMQLATEANEAYRTLKNPTARARYLLHLHGMEVNEESNTVMPAEFLMLQMEWRESIEDAKAEHDVAALEKLLKKAQQEARTIQENLGNLLDNAELEEAASSVRKLSFIDKICSDIEQDLIRLED
ncbi:MAG TPA: Fe-S protein assembly co-chaperone HscB [Methylophilaceae bacterium]|nr:Fe-S protein assembly co-chaperone HscB [Methylophilaceae bacterium]